VARLSSQGGTLPGEQPPLDAGSKLPQVLGVVTVHVNANYITTHNVADYPILQILYPVPLGSLRERYFMPL